MMVKTATSLRTNMVMQSNTTKTLRGVAVKLGAMGEGFGDYLAASFYADAGDPTFQASHAAAVGEWDATSYSGANPPNLRRVDGNKIYPDDLSGQVHADGEIWSAALWDIRQQLGGPTTDAIVLESHFGLPGGATMPQGAEQILLADQNLNGGANQAAIRQAFEDRGILEPSPNQGAVEFDNFRYASTGVIGITVVDANAIDPVEVQVETSSGDSETITLTMTGESTFEGTIDNIPGEPIQDGIIQGYGGEELTVTYLDLDDGTGNSLTVQDDAEIRDYTEYPSTDTPLPINSESSISSTLTVTDEGTVNDVLLNLNITHTWDADLDVSLTSPSGTQVLLFSGVGSSGDDFIDTTLDDEATTAITIGTAPFTGHFSPQEMLSSFDDESITGDWTLTVTDTAAGDDGALENWSPSLLMLGKTFRYSVRPPLSRETDSGFVDAAFEIELGGVATQAMRVGYETTIEGLSNPATPGVDFLEVSGIATFQPGDSVVTVNVPVNGEKLVEGLERFGLKIFAPSDNAELDIERHDVSIQDNDEFELGVPIDFATDTSSIDANAIGFQTQPYSAELGLGWENTVGLGIFDSPRGNDLVSDRAQVRAGTFLVDVPNGTYDVTIYFGQVRRKDPITLSFEDGPDIIETLTLGPNITRTFPVTVADGQLSINVQGPPGFDNRIRFGAIEINSVSSKGNIFDGGGKGSNGALYWAPNLNASSVLDATPSNTIPTSIQIHSAQTVPTVLSTANEANLLESPVLQDAQQTKLATQQSELDQIFEDFEFQI